MIDQCRSRGECRRRDLRQWYHRSRHAAHLDAIERLWRRPTTVIHPHHQWILVAIRSANFTGFKAGNAKSKRPFHFCGRYAKQSGLLAIDMQTQIRSPQSDRIVHILRALGARQHLFQLRGQLRQCIEVGAFDAHRDRRVDGRTVHEFLDLDARAWIGRELASQ